MVGYLELMGYLKEMGFYDFALPWLLAFAIVYGILGTTGIFKNKSVNAIISVVFAFFVAAYTPYGIGVSQFFTSMFGQGMLILSTVLVLILFLGFVGLASAGKAGVFTEHKLFWSVFFIILTVILAVNAGLFAITIPSISADLMELGSILLFIAILFVAVYFVARPEGKMEKAPKEEKIDKEERVK